MRAQVMALLGAGGLPAAGGLALVLSWVFAFERDEPAIGFVYLVAGIVVLTWATVLEGRKRRQRPGSGTGDRDGA